MKPRLFIGSSSEGVTIARRFAALLSDVADPVIWERAPEFEPMRSTLDGLLESVERYDYGLFVFSPDDEITSRGLKHKSARDNVILELGLFLGRLGRDRAFAVVSQGTDATENLKAISDLFGITLPRFSNEGGRAAADSIRAAASQIRTKILAGGRRQLHIPLIRKWRFSKNSAKFTATISGTETDDGWKVLSGKRIVVVCRRKDESINLDDDSRLAISEPWSLPKVRSTDLKIEVQTDVLGEDVRRDVIEAYVVLIPDRLKVLRGTTLGALTSRGCDIVDAVAISPDSGSARRLLM
jgi:hypothetical protein